MKYRVIQWATGNVGRSAVEGILAHPELELIGVWVHSKAKAGRDTPEREEDRTRTLEDGLALLRRQRRTGLGDKGGAQQRGGVANRFDLLTQPRVVGETLLEGRRCLRVEFAKVEHEEGKSLFDAAMSAAKLRFRAVLMTAFSFILGVVPLVIASGAGAASRRTLGTAVFGGMLAATVFGVFLIPVLYVVVQRTSEWLRGIPDNRPVEQAPARK